MPRPAQTLAIASLALVLSSCGSGNGPDCTLPGADGTPCGGAEVCSDGACVPSSTTRTVTGAFRTLHRADDGPEVEVGGPPLYGTLPTALLVPDGSPDGFTTFPVTLEANGTFAVPGVPVGMYFLRMDRPTLIRQSDGAPGVDYVAGVASELVPLVQSAPDLSRVVAYRPDLARVTTATPVSVSMSGLDPWASFSNLHVVSAKADVLKRPDLLAPRPATGSTSHSFTLDWSLLIGEPRGSGLPDAARGDVAFWYQRSASQAASGSENATVKRATRYAALDSMLVQDGVSSSVTVPLLEAPQDGTVSTGFSASLFAALASDVNPVATPVALDLSVFATPGPLEYPDMPDRPFAPLFGLASGATADVDFGTFPYGRFLGQGWREFRVASYQFEIPFAVDFGALSSIVATESASVPRTTPVRPTLGPPRNPLINGSSAFASASGVGLQPVLSWSPPSTGAATSYQVTIRCFRGLQPGEVGELSATIYGATSFHVPPGFLQAGHLYFAHITARRAPWDVPTRSPFRGGVPLSAADCVTGLFWP